MYSRKRKNLPKLRVVSYKNKKHKYKLNESKKKRRLAIDEGVINESKKLNVTKKVAAQKEAYLLVDAKTLLSVLTTEALQQAMDQRDLKQLRLVAKIAEKEADVEEAVLLKAKSMISALATEGLQGVMKERNLGWEPLMVLLQRTMLTHFVLLQLSQVE